MRKHNVAHRLLAAMAGAGEAYSPSLPDNREHRVAESDTLWGLAGLYFALLSRAYGFWWAIADFQPDPIVDPTLGLEVGRVLILPSTRVLPDVILGQARRWVHG